MLVLALTAMAQSKSISGKVVDANGEPLIGVSVLVQGTTTGTMTYVDGKFALDVPANSVLEVSSIGFVTQTLAVGSRAVFDLVLEEDAELLEGTVVVGYGTVKRTNFTGSVSTYKVGDSPLANTMPSNALELLRGAATGLTMSQSGVAGSSPSIMIRGQKSISGGSDPLIVKDGIIFQGSINDIDPNTIESMSVMKDATSLAAYGSQAANGVIMITTKKGAVGKPVINFRGSVALVQQNYTPDFRDGDEFIELVNARKGFAADDTSWMSPIEKENYDKGQTTDWVDYVTQLGVVRTIHSMYQERTRELSWEEHRWPTLLRMGKTGATNEVMHHQINNHAMYVNDLPVYKDGIKWSLFPIPQSIIQMNVDAPMKQNPGW